MYCVCAIMELTVFKVGITSQILSKNDIGFGYIYIHMDKIM